MADDIVRIDPRSDAIFKAGKQYFQSIQIVRSFSSQRIYQHCLVSFKSEPDEVSKFFDRKWFDCHWKVGVVKKIWKDVKSREYFVELNLWFPHMYVKKNNLVSDKLLKQKLLKRMRHDFMLWPTSETVTVAVNKILNVVVLLKQHSDFTNKQKPAMTNGITSVAFHATYGLPDSPDTPVKKAADLEYVRCCEIDSRTEDTTRTTAQKRSVDAPADMMQESTQSTKAMPNKKRRVTIDAPVSEKEKKKGKRKTATLIRTESPRVVGEPLFQHQTKSSKLYFFDELLMPWTVRVGDLVAIHTDVSNPQYIYTSRGRQTVWYPFDEAWSAAQVLAIYVTQDNEHVVQVRWFYRPHELPKETSLTVANKKELFRSDSLSGRHMIEVDECVEEVQANDIIGRVRATSELEPSSKFLNTYKDNSVSVLPIIVRHSFSLEHFSGVEGLQKISDWDDYGNDSAPFQRGLSCKKAYPGTIPALFEAYGGQKAKRQAKDQGQNGGTAGITSESEEEPAATWPDDLLGEYMLQPVAPRNVLHKCDNREYLRAVSIKSIVRRCNPRATAKKTTDLQWELQIGQIVCIADNSAPQRSIKNQKNMWFPFVGPWRFGQVLSIYRDGGGVPLLEVRWFLRRSELPPEVFHWMPPPLRKIGNVEEVYENDSVAIGVPVSRVLGHGSIFLGHLDKESNPADDSLKEIPGASCRCRYFFFSEQMRFQPIYCSSVEPRKWFQMILERGFKTSQMVKQDSTLARMIEFCSDVRLDISTRNALARTWEDFEDIHEPTDAILFENQSKGRPGRHFFLSCSEVPQWSKYAKDDVVCPLKDRRGLRWTVCVGDIVAIECQDITSHKSEELFPFSVAWRPAQVLAIFKDGFQDDGFHLQIRWFCRSYENELLQGGVHCKGLDLLYSTDDLDSVSQSTAKLLGPIALLPGNEKDRVSCRGLSFWENLSAFMPAAPFIYAGHFDTKHKRKVKAPSIRQLVQNGLSLSGFYCDDAEFNRLLSEIKHMVGKLSERGQKLQLTMQLFLFHNDIGADDASTVVSSDSRKTIKGTKAWTSVPPFYVDRSETVEYFAEIDLEPPYQSYSIDIPSSRTQKTVWTVRIGDVVVLHYHGKSDGRYTYIHHSLKEGKLQSTRNFPFTVSSAVGQVVTIRREQDRQSSPSRDGGDLKLEIRWFFRQGEIPRGVAVEASSDLDCEEIFESDLYDEVSPSSLLAPASVSDMKKTVEFGKELSGMPVVEFFCRRFWSSHRKCLLPVGSVDGITARALSLSKLVEKDPSLKAALQEIMKTVDASCSLMIGYSHAPSDATPKHPWKKAFSSVIQKLSLTDASKEANCSGDALVGRENERRQILSFLRVSIAGHAGESTKPCLFVAGPPGTGKTASIRATIHELQREQRTGKVPYFEFISLNGMEMRHPFDAYSKLWEEINNGNVNFAGEAAASRLEAYFSGKDSSPNDNKRILVVLLDEIDYLVTKKQTVLYNFFDWPSRSVANASMRRLIVIGVSNTLNLPERLQPRVQSRMGSKRIFFKSYSVDETVQILKSKMTQASPHCTVFDRDAILYASKKTAALSGDIRKAFHICRSAAEMVLNERDDDNSCEEAPIVRIKDVLKVSQESFNSAQSRSVTLCAAFEALLLVSLASLGRTTGREYGGFDVEEILAKMSAIADALGKPLYLPPPTLQETLGIISRLGEMRLVSLETPRNTSLSYRASSAGTGGAWPIVSLVTDDLGLLIALKETPHNELAQKYLSRNASR